MAGPDAEHREANLTAELGDWARSLAAKAAGTSLVLSPWVQRFLQAEGQGSQKGAPARTILERETPALLARLGRKQDALRVWRPDAGSVSPATFDHFAGEVAGRYQTSGARYLPQEAEREPEAETELVLAPHGAITPGEPADRGQSLQMFEEPLELAPEAFAAPPQDEPAAPGGGPQAPSDQVELGQPPWLRPGGLGPQGRVQRRSSVRPVSRVEEITPGGKMPPAAGEDAARTPGQQASSGLDAQPEGPRPAGAGQPQAPSQGMEEPSPRVEAGEPSAHLAQPATGPARHLPEPRADSVAARERPAPHFWEGPTRGRPPAAPRTRQDAAQPPVPPAGLQRQGKMGPAEVSTGDSAPVESTDALGQPSWTPEQAAHPHHAEGLVPPEHARQAEPAPRPTPSEPGLPTPGVGRVPAPAEEPKEGTTAATLEPGLEGVQRSQAGAQRVEEAQTQPPGATQPPARERAEVAPAAPREAISRDQESVQRTAPAETSQAARPTLDASLPLPRARPPAGDWEGAELPAEIEQSLPPLAHEETPTSAPPPADAPPPLQRTAGGQAPDRGVAAQAGETGPAAEQGRGQPTQQPPAEPRPRPIQRVTEEEGRQAPAGQVPAEQAAPHGPDPSRGRATPEPATPSLRHPPEASHPEDSQAVGSSDDLLRPQKPPAAPGDNLEGAAKGPQPHVSGDIATGGEPSLPRGAAEPRMGEPQPPSVAQERLGPAAEPPSTPAGVRRAQETPSPTRRDAPAQGRPAEEATAQRTPEQGVAPKPGAQSRPPTAGSPPVQRWPEGMPPRAARGLDAEVARPEAPDRRAPGAPAADEPAPPQPEAEAPIPPVEEAGSSRQAGPELARLAGIETTRAAVVETPPEVTARPAAQRDLGPEGPSSERPAVPAEPSKEQLAKGPGPGIEGQRPLQSRLQAGDQGKPGEPSAVPELDRPPALFRAEERPTAPGEPPAEGSSADVRHPEVQRLPRPPMTHRPGTELGRAGPPEERSGPQAQEAAPPQRPLSPEAEPGLAPGAVGDGNPPHMESPAGLGEELLSRAASRAHLPLTEVDRPEPRPGPELPPAGTRRPAVSAADIQPPRRGIAGQPGVQRQAPPAARRGDLDSRWAVSEGERGAFAVPDAATPALQAVGRPAFREPARVAEKPRPSSPDQATLAPAASGSAPSDRVQRLPLAGPAVSPAMDAGAPTLQRAQETETGPTLAPEAPGAPEWDLDDLAHQVYPLVRRMLAIERERIPR